jgi:hypothetical protein
MQKENGCTDGNDLWKLQKGSGSLIEPRRMLELERKQGGGSWAW